MWFIVNILFLIYFIIVFLYSLEAGTAAKSVKDIAGFTKLKYRQKGQGNREDVAEMAADMKKKLEEKEVCTHFIFISITIFRLAIISFIKFHFQVHFLCNQH